MKWKNGWMVLFLVFGLAGLAQAVMQQCDEAGWFYSGQTRYNPSLDLAQYRQGDSWVDDIHHETNPAYNNYISAGSPCGSPTEYPDDPPNDPPNDPPDDPPHDSSNGSYGCSDSSSPSMANGYNTAIYRSKAVHSKVEYVNFFDQNPGNDDGLCDFACTENEINTCMQSCGYKDSNRPEWSTRLFAGVTYDKLDYGVCLGNLHANTEITTVEGGAVFRKDRFSILTSARYEYASGHELVDDLRSDTYGFLVMPAYRILQQDENFVNAHLYAFLDLSFVDMTREDNQWRMMPGVAASVSRSTPIGSFMAAYSYGYNRNQSGDVEVTGSHHINTHNSSVSYVLPVTRNVYVGTGLENTYISSTPETVDHSFTDVRLQLGAVQLKNWNFSVSYYFSVDSSGNNGGDFMVGRAW